MLKSRLFRMMQYTPSMMMMMRLAVVLCWVYPVLGDVKQFIWIENRKLRDVAITDNIISSVNNVTTLLECSRNCGQYPECRSFTYNTDRTCRLHSVRLAKASSLPSFGSRHYYDTAGDCRGEDEYVPLKDVNVCFKVHRKRKWWTRSRNSCIREGSRLIVLDTEEKYTAVRDYMKRNGDVSRYWIGLTDRKKEGVFVWENGNNLSFAKWNPMSPNNNMRNEDCVILVVSKNWWNDVICGFRGYYICEQLI